MVKKENVTRPGKEDERNEDNETKLKTLLKNKYITRKWPQLRTKMEDKFKNMVSENYMTKMKTKFGPMVKTKFTNRKRTTANKERQQVQA